MSFESPRILVLGHLTHAHKEIEQLGSIYQVDHVTSASREEFYQESKIKYSDAAVVFRTHAAGEHFRKLDAEFVSHLPKTVTLFITEGTDYSDVDIEAFEKRHIWIANVPPVSLGSDNEATYASELSALDSITQYLTSLPAPPPNAVNRVDPSAKQAAALSSEELFDETAPVEGGDDSAPQKNYWRLSRQQKRASQVMEQVDFSGIEFRLY